MTYDKTFRLERRRLERDARKLADKVDSFEGEAAAPIAEDFFNRIVTLADHKGRSTRKTFAMLPNRTKQTIGRIFDLSPQFEVDEVPQGDTERVKSLGEFQNYARLHAQDGQYREFGSKETGDHLAHM